jgi:SAM-dependent methyltransferase
MNVFAPDYQTPERMSLKRAAIPLPDFAGKRVLDVGCDHGYWSFLAAEQGAAQVVGLDRNREVRGRGFTNLIAQNEAIARADQRYRACEFQRIDLGKQYRIFGHFDVVLCLSVYHHIYEAAGGDHMPVWLWLWHHAQLSRSVLLWEGPVDANDPVVRANVSAEHQTNYTRDAILAAGSCFFHGEFIGPALHEPTREVWRFTPRDRVETSVDGLMENGAGGATKAFEYAGGRRMDEIAQVLGNRPVPGSLNVRLDKAFDWNTDYFRAQILDVEDRASGIAGKWSPRWARFYPVAIDGEDAYAFRFEGETYDPRFVELIAPWRLRDMVNGPRVTLCR